MSEESGVLGERRECVYFIEHCFELLGVSILRCFEIRSFHHIHQLTAVKSQYQ